jgi:hypothetical protein
MMSKMGHLMRAATPPALLQQHLEGRARLIAGVDKMRKRSRARPLFGALVLGAAATIGVLAWPRLHALPPPVSWHVENGVVGAQGYVSVEATAPAARLVFDEGSDISLEPASRARVAAASAAGAELMLEQGRARVHVRHRDGTKWAIDAGPFAVHVTGTEFTIAWSAEAETLDVWMRSGRVEVSGPMPGEALALVAGKHLRARSREQAVLIDGETEPLDSREAVGVEESTSPGGSASVAAVAATHPEPVTAATSPSAPFSPGVASWSRLVAAGDFARVVREAEAAGAARAVASRPLGDLRALGDAARYAGEVALARKAYGAIRQRFRSSGEARTAAFLMGRIAEEQEHADAEALRWYDTYLAEAPGGAFAGDALGRKMVLVAKSQGRDSARALAQQYLNGFPGGPYSAAARDLLP